MPWKTAITKIEPNKITVRGYELSTLIGKASYAQMVYLLLKGEMPDERTAKMIEAILVSSVDHGVTPPSCLAARTVASCGAPLSTALAAGVMSISRHHGGAIEDSMKMFYDAKARLAEGTSSATQLASKLIDAAKEAGKRLPGFGHRIHTDDPRTRTLLRLARNLGLAGKAQEIAEAIEKTFAERGRALPLNVDGAIAAILCDLGFPAEIGNAFFIISRLPGLVAHVQEETTREKPMRTINPLDYEYDGK
jgi:citrate synthase